MDREGFAGQGAGYDAAAGTVEFNTGFSWSSWKGQDMEAVVREPAPGSTRVSLTGGLALKVQLTSWGEKKRIARKVLARVEQSGGAGAGTVGIEGPERGAEPAR